MASIETNHFGTDEFMAWCDELGTEPIWCLGNEMDTPWQAGHVSATTYAERASAAGALMKGLDPTIETVGCGSSTNWLPTYPEWDRIVLEECWNHIDYISAHHYSRNDEDDTASFLAQGIELDAIITQYRGLIDHVSALKRSFHRVHVSFDEWNVWYREMPTRGDFQEAPHLLEETYNLQDALVCAQYLHSFLPPPPPSCTRTPKPRTTGARRRDAARCGCHISPRGPRPSTTTERAGSGTPA